MKNWSSGNSFLRHLNDESRSERVLSMDTLSPRELQLGLEAIQEFVTRMNYGKAKIEILPGTINICIESSKEMSS